MTPTRRTLDRIRRRACLFAAAGLLAVAPGRAVESGSASTEPPALTFVLKDQFDTEHTDAMCAGRIALIIEADRAGSRYSTDWSVAIREAMDETLRQETVWIGVANLRGVPSLLRGFVKGRFPQDPSSWTLLDWKSEFAERYALPSDCCNVLVFAPNGHLVHHNRGREVDPAAVDDIIAAIESLTPLPSAGHPRA